MTAEELQDRLLKKLERLNIDPGVLYQNRVMAVQNPINGEIVYYLDWNKASQVKLITNPFGE